MADQVLYLNRSNASPMFNKLKRVIEESKQGKAGPAQWASMIKALSSKGVKSMEIDESNIIAWLEHLDPVKPVTKEELIQKLDSLLFTVKEVCLASPRFSGHRQKGGNYKEYLYVANSERANIEEDLERVEYEMNELVFSPERLVDEPDLPIRLERQRSSLIELKGKSIDFANHHFTADAGRHGKNLLAHCRITERPDFGLYFIEEVQSDWAQRGRKSDWNGIPKGPLVTNTEAWAGMVLRRHFQIAANNPKVGKVAWITESMRNGGQQTLEGEEAKRQQKARFDEALKAGLDEALAKIPNIDALDATGKEEVKKLARDNVARDLARQGISEPYDMLNDFYLKVIPKIVDKILAGTGEKVQLQDVRLDVDRVVKVPTINLTEAVRQKLVDKQPVYSRAILLPKPRQEDDPVIRRLISNAAHVLGSAKHFYLVSHLYDVATGRKVAGRYINGVTQVALSAKDIEEVADHECFHFAQENMLTMHEMRVLREEFRSDSDLNFRVREILVKRGDMALAQDCIHPDECAAQAYALWKSGQLVVTPKPVTSVFGEVKQAVSDVVSWIRSEVLLQKLNSVEQIFAAFASGDIAQRSKKTEKPSDQNDFNSNGTENKYAFSKERQVL